MVPPQSDILKLNVPNNQALIWIIAVTLFYSWSSRVSKKVADKLQFQAHLDAELKLMKETQRSQLAEEIQVIIRQATF